jgi:IS605 OrfB family transposase
MSEPLPTKLALVKKRKLFVDLMQKKDLNTLKKSYLTKHEITARQFNALRITLQGKIDSIKELRQINIANLKEKITSLEKKLPKIRSKMARHGKTRKLHAMKNRLGKLELEQTDFEEWKEDWVQSRNSEFFCIGSKDERAGNQSCVLTFDAHQKGTLRLRLPNALAKIHGKYLEINDVVFAYGQKEIEKALEVGTALSYRFKKDAKGWRVFLSLAEEAAPILTKSILGAIGIDINVDHIALVEIDPQGNPIRKETIPLNTYGKTKEQAKALTGDGCTKIVSIATEVRKPIIIEKLDFSKKKATLKETHPKHARMLSSFSYSQVIEGLTSKGFKEGVEIFSVNPAMTSIIGKIKYACRYGLSVHHSAALCIARRYYKFSEAPSKSPMKVVHRNVQVTCPKPERKRGQHVWTFWRNANRKLQTVLAAHFRARKRSPCPA